MSEADAADGRIDYIIDLTNLADLPYSYRIDGSTRYQTGRALQSAGDWDGDGKGDLLIGAPAAGENGYNSGSVFLLSTGDLAAANEADGSRDGVVSLDYVAQQPGSYRFDGTYSDLAGTTVAFADDLTGDGQPDIVVGVPDDEYGRYSAGANL